MRIDREEIHENKIVCSNTMQITLDDDFNVPDSKADIETIVKERGSVHIDTVKAVGDRAEVTGGMDFAVLYAGSESGEKSVLPVKMTGTMNIGEVVNLSGDCENTYVSCQAKLEEWIAAAKKERDYANDNMQKLYNSYIGNCDTYLQKVNLALTDVGSKGQSLALTKNRMSNEQETMEELKSKNEDRELSDIILEYTAAYTAYQSSLQAASKVNQVTLLSYL